MNTILFALILSFNLGGRDGTTAIIPNFESAVACEIAADSMTKAMKLMDKLDSPVEFDKRMAHQCVPYKLK